MSPSRKTTISWLAPSGERHRVAAVASPAPAGVLAELAEPAVVGRTVWVEWEPAERRAFVRSCEARDGRYLAELTFLAQERRREDRIPSAGNGSLEWFEMREKRAAPVVVEDVTEGGVRLRLEESLSQVDMVRLTGETWECLGKVRYCLARDGGTVLGIELAGPAYLKDSADYFD